MTAFAALLGPGVALAEPPLPPTSPTDTIAAAATFDFAWNRIRDTHWDPDFGGVDWEGVRAELRPSALAAASTPELRDVLREMLDRLGDSHFVLIPAEAASPAGPGEAGSGGVGMELRWSDGATLVTRVDAGSTAEAEGVRPGYELVSVDGRGVDEIVGQLSAERGGPAADPPPHWITAALARVLSGPPGTTVEVQVRGADGRSRSIDLARAEPAGEVVRFGHLPPFRLQVDDRALELADGGRVGYIRFSGWFPAAAPAIARAVDEFRSAEGIVIDLRGNPGGIGGLVMGIGGHFLDEQVDLGTMRTRETTVRFRVNPQRVAPDGRRVEPYAGPLAILIDGLSGSTSEIFAGGLQALGRAWIIGEPSAGEALPALVVELPNGDRLMHAIADFTAPDGSRLEGRGVQPDHFVAPDRDSLLAGEDPALRAALDWIAGATHPTETRP